MLIKINRQLLRLKHHAMINFVVILIANHPTIKIMLFLPALAMVIAMLLCIITSRRISGKPRFERLAQ
jgi:hypothetical protein